MKLRHRYLTTNSTESMMNLANDYLMLLMATELANYIPEDFEVTDWLGETTAPECDIVVEEATEATTAVDEPKVKATTEENTVEAEITDEAIEVEEAENTQDNQIEEDDSDSYYIADDTKDEDSEGIVMYTTVDGKKYKLTISFN